MTDTIIPDMEAKPFALFGHDLFGHPIQQRKGGPLAQRFEFPPFSVLNAREGDWQERKRAWIGLGIKSEVGRGSNTLKLSEECEEYRKSTGDYDKAAPGGGALPACDYQNRERGSGSGSAIPGTSANGYAQSYNSGSPGSPGSPGSLGRAYAGGCRPHVGGAADERPGREPGTEYEGGDAWVASANNSGTSIFDPVLAEICYRWFCPEAGQIVDPFAGGSVRGIVAAMLGFGYWGCDLRPEQIAANEVQRAELCTAEEAERIKWVCGDSIDRLVEAPSADFVFTCPPYGDLERYSDDPADLSTMEYHTFLASYKRIVMRCAKVLKRGRYACFVVGDFRDRRSGYYRGFVADTVNAFREQGMHLYNDAILVTAVGSLPIRVGKQFEASRKLGKTHQNVLVFVKP